MLSAALTVIECGHFLPERQIFPKQVFQKQRAFPVHCDIAEPLENQTVHIDLNRRHIHPLQIGQGRIRLRMILTIENQLIR